jgi:acyl carrier protein
MFGYQRIKLLIDPKSEFKIINMPQMNNFKIVLTGSARDNSNVDIILEAEDELKENIPKKLEQQCKNLKVYLNLFSDVSVNIVPHDSIKIFPDKLTYETLVLDSLDALKDPHLHDYLNGTTTAQHDLLQIALNELGKKDFFNAFPKLINWLDDNDAKGSSRFCSIRDSCDHGKLDRAIKNVNDKFPDEFEFEDNILKRDSLKNITSMEKYIPEVLDHIKRIFKAKYVK